MNIRALLFLLGLLGFAPLARAHSPFDASSRIIVHEDSAEVMFTVGSTLGESFLAAENPGHPPLVLGRIVPLSPAAAARWFTISTNGQPLAARAADVITDGVEYQFHAEYALAGGTALGVRPNFLPALKPPSALPVVVTDENGNIRASAILSLEKTETEFALAAPSPRPNGERAGVRGIESTNHSLLTPALSSKGGEGEGSKRSADSEVPRPAPSFLEFLKLGIGHILNLDAFDHLLFLAALLLGCRQARTMLLVVTGFTVAHSVTLALAALNVVTLAPRIVEPAIALSILFVAAENFRKSEPLWHRHALTCGFGLIHGFAFAGILRESGLAGTGLAIVKPLLAFNLGVEIAQVVVVFCLLPLLLVANRWAWFARNGARLISVFVMAVAAWWLWERLAS